MFSNGLDRKGKVGREGRGSRAGKEAKGKGKITVGMKKEGGIYEEAGRRKGLRALCFV